MTIGLASAYIGVKLPIKKSHVETQKIVECENQKGIYVCHDQLYIKRIEQ